MAFSLHGCRAVRAVSRGARSPGGTVVAEGSRAKRGAQQLADEGAVGGMEGADGRAGEAGLDGRAAVARPPGLGRDPQVARVAALEIGDDRRTGAEPPGEDLHGRPAERAGAVGELDARFAVQVQGADVEARELGDAPAGVRDERGQGGGPQRCRGVGVDGLRTVRSWRTRPVSAGVR